MSIHVPAGISNNTLYGRWYIASSRQLATVESIDMIQGPHPLGEVDRQLLKVTVLGVEDHTVDARIHLLLQSRQLCRRRNFRPQLGDDLPGAGRSHHTCEETVDAQYDSEE